METCNRKQVANQQPVVARRYLKADTVTCILSKYIMDMLDSARSAIKLPCDCTLQLFIQIRFEPERMRAGILLLMLCLHLL